MIQMICGYTGVGTKLVGPKDGPFELSAEAEKRLVDLGVAEYVGKALASPPADEGEKAKAQTGENTSRTPEPAEDALAPQAPVALDDCIEIDESGHMTEESLMRLTRANMEALASDLGIDASKCRNKSEIAALLTQVVMDAGQEDAPQLGAALPQ